MKTSLLLLALVSAAPIAVAQVHVAVPGVNVPNPGPNDLAVDTNHNQKTVRCKDGGGLYLRGNNNSLQVDGSCSTVHILGNHNTVTVAQRTALVTEGNNNVVHYTDAKTTVSTLGNGNSVSQVGR